MVKNILGMVAGGYTVPQVLDTYPELTQEQVQTAFRYVREQASFQSDLPNSIT